MSDMLHTISAETRARERTDVAIALLLVQAVLGLLALLGMVVLSALMPLISPAGLLVSAGFFVPLLSAVGRARGWHWADRVARLWQVLTLLSVGVNLVLATLPQVQMELTLSGILSGVALPAGILVMMSAPLPASVRASRADKAQPSAAATASMARSQRMAEGA